MKNVLLFFSLFYSFTAYGQSNIIEGILIDPSIKTEVNKRIKPMPRFEELGNEWQIYSNTLIAEMLSEDTVLVAKESDSAQHIFKAFHFKQGDTLGINGAFGLFGGTGFYIRIINNRATLFHMLSADDFPAFAYNETDSIVFRLEVPCRDTKIILSQNPKFKKGEIIYGYVEFKSNPFYSLTSEDQREKLQNNMKIYFKSGFLEF